MKLLPMIKTILHACFLSLSSFSISFTPLSIYTIFLASNYSGHILFCNALTPYTLLTIPHLIMNTIHASIHDDPPLALPIWHYASKNSPCI